MSIFSKPTLLHCVFLALIACSNSPAHKDAHSLIQETNLPRTAVESPRSNIGDFSKGDGAEIILKPGDDLVAIFDSLRGSMSIKSIKFTPGDYVVKGPLNLPRTRSLVVIDGQGSNLVGAKGQPIFYSIPADQSEAMIFNKTRYLIRNFGQIKGGSKGIFLGSSFNTIIENIEFVGQEEASIDLVFCLMCTVRQVLITNVFHDGVVLRSGVDRDTKANTWPGTSFNNSQCNHTVLQSVRVYNKKECTGTSFKVLQSTGVRLIDCISEGWENERAVFFDAAGCTTAKFFSIQNFHLEHMPRDGAMVFQSFGTTVEVDGLFLQKGSETSPAIWLMNNGTYIFKNIPWWPQGAWVKSSNAPRVLLMHCAKEFQVSEEVWRNWERPGQPIYRPYFRTSDDITKIK